VDELMYVENSIGVLCQDNTAFETKATKAPKTTFAKQAPIPPQAPVKTTHV